MLCTFTILFELMLIIEKQLSPMKKKPRLISQIIRKFFPFKQKYAICLKHFFETFYFNINYYIDYNNYIKEVICEQNWIFLFTLLLKNFLTTSKNISALIIL